jgi:DNA-binding transcriptional ArsR family regulator
MPPAEDQIIVTSENVKGLAHPLRPRVLGLLRTYGPATATSLAAELGLTSGALSYHLRQLEKYGFIVEDTERGNQRERWWKAAHRSTVFVEPSRDGDALVYEDAIVEAITRTVARARAARHELPEEWQQAFDFSDDLLRLTPDEAHQLSRDLVALLASYRRHVPGEAGPAGSRLVAAQFQVLPLPEPRAMGQGEPDTIAMGES